MRKRYVVFFLFAGFSFGVIVTLFCIGRQEHATFERDLKSMRASNDSMIQKLNREIFVEDSIFSLNQNFYENKRPLRKSVDR